MSWKEKVSGPGILGELLRVEGGCFFFMFVFSEGGAGFTRTGWEMADEAGDGVVGLPIERRKAAWWTRFPVLALGFCTLTEEGVRMSLLVAGETTVAGEDDRICSSLCTWVVKASV